MQEEDAAAYQVLTQRSIVNFGVVHVSKLNLPARRSKRETSSYYKRNAIETSGSISLLSNVFFSIRFPI